MTVDNNHLETASPLVRRQAALHWELNHVVLDTVFKARDSLQLTHLLSEQVYSRAQFAKLPKFRQIALDSYLAGVLDGLARATGAAMSASERPKTVPPKRGKNKKRGAGKSAPSEPPKLYPSAGVQYPIPVWINPGPQAYLHAPAVPNV